MSLATVHIFQYYLDHYQIVASLVILIRPKEQTITNRADDYWDVLSQ